MHFGPIVYLVISYDWAVLVLMNNDEAARYDEQCERKRNRNQILTVRCERSGETLFLVPFSNCDGIV